MMGLTCTPRGARRCGRARAPPTRTRSAREGAAARAPRARAAPGRLRGVMSSCGGGWGVMLRVVDDAAAADPRASRIIQGTAPRRAPPLPGDRAGISPPWCRKRVRRGKATHQVSPTHHPWYKLDTIRGAHRVEGREDVVPHAVAAPQRRGYVLLLRLKLRDLLRLARHTVCFRLFQARLLSSATRSGHSALHPLPFPSY